MKKSVVVGLLLLAGFMSSIWGSGANRCCFISGFSASYLSAETTSVLSTSFNYTVTLTTSMGTIVIGLFDDMPITTGNFENLTQLGYYDDTIFHRVVHDFVIQGGDLSGKGIVVPTIPDELPNKHSNVRGSVAMAKTSLPNSATSQFYINLVNNTFLDSNYSVFGEVIQGMNVVDSIGSVPTDINDRPLQDVTVLTARLHSVEGTGPVYIRTDGSIDPPDAPISTFDYVTYTLTGNITTDADGIVVERDNIVIDGAGYTLQGSGNGGGFALSGMNNVTIKHANIRNFDYGIFLYFSSNNSISENSITANNYDGIVFYDSSNNTVSRNNITNNQYGIDLDSSSNNSISGNYIANNWFGIELYFSSNDSVAGNSITANIYYGIYLGNSSDSSLEGNNITANGDISIYLYSSSSNSIFGNNMTNNQCGIELSSSSSNKVFHNNIINNTNQLYSYDSVNHWDYGYPSGGNYWTDYNGTDLFSGTYQNETGSDNIGDTPYVIDVSNQDNCPLMSPYGPYENQTIYIRADGSVGPTGAPILRKGDLYTLTGNITSNVDGILVQRNNTIIDGNGYALEGSGTGYGFSAARVVNVTIKNTIIRRFYYGVTFNLSSCNNFIGNTVVENGFGIMLQESSDNRIVENEMALNYLLAIDISNSSHNTLSRNSITDNEHAMRCSSSSNNTISGNNVTRNNWGIWLFESSNSSIAGNKITANVYYGVKLEFSSKISIIGNEIREQAYQGIDIYSSSNNTISGNNIADNNIGIWVEIPCWNNVVYHNNFLNNTNQVFTPFAVNVWDNGCEGNYWSNYNGTDLENDGVGDTLLPWEGVDKCPLMNVYWNPCDINHDLKVDMRDVGASARAFGTIPGNAKWNPHADITGPEPLVSDGKVDMRDINLIAKHFGERYP